MYFLKKYYIVYFFPVIEKNKKCFISWLYYIFQFLIDTTPPVLRLSLMPLRLAQRLGGPSTGDWFQHVGCLITSFTVLLHQSVIGDAPILSDAWCSPRTLQPVSRHWSCQSGESNLSARISGDVQAGIRLRPVNSMHLAKMKGSPRCAMQLLFTKFIKTVTNIL